LTPYRVGTYLLLFRYVGVFSNNLTEFFAVNGFFSIKRSTKRSITVRFSHQPLASSAIFYNDADLVIDSRGDCF